MRQIIVAVALMSACSSPMSASPTVAGTWAEHFSILGASLVVTVDGAGNGSGTYAIEAGRSGMVQVAGTVAAARVSLMIRYDYGPVRTFSGALTDANHLSGTFDGETGMVVFTRR